MKNATKAKKESESIGELIGVNGNDWDVPLDMETRVDFKRMGNLTCCCSNYYNGLNTG